MKKVLLGICLITFTILQLLAAVSSTDLHDFVKLLHQNNAFDSLQDPLNDTMMIVITDQDSQDFNIEEEIEQMKLLRNKDLSDEILKEDDDEDEEEPDPLTIAENGTEKLALRNGIRRPRPRKKRKKASDRKDPPKYGQDAWPRERLKAHERRIREVSDHMIHNRITTIYLYNEVLRIKRDRVVLDDLRAMALELEDPNYRNLKSKVMACYEVFSPSKVHVPWPHNTNNLVIHSKKDPINDNVHN